MSKAIKTVAKIALPIAASFIPGVGPLAAAAVGAGLGAMDGGGLKGAILGGISGYTGATAASGLIGTAAHTLPAGVAGPVTYGSGLKGLVTGGGMRALGGTVSSIASSFDPTKLLTTVGNQLMAGEESKTALEAANIQAQGYRDAASANAAANAPYTELGQNAVSKINTIEQDPAAYVQNNPFYKSLADDAQRRLLANQAAKGKVGSGGTAAALNEQLLQLGTGLVNNDVNRLQTQANLGQNSAVNVGAVNANAAANSAEADAAGRIGSLQAYKAGYQNQINTLLAMQGLNKAPIYSNPVNI